MSPEQPDHGAVPGRGGHWVAPHTPDAAHWVSDRSDDPEAGRWAAGKLDGFHDDEGDAARRELLIGAVILAIGLAVTIGSYIVAGNAAEQTGSGTYVVTWGLIAVGAVKTIRGLYRMLS